MRRALALVALLAGCAEPPRTMQMELAVSALADLHVWEPATEARGQTAYDAVVGWGPEIWPVLAAHITDETPTAIYLSGFDRQVTVGDVCFYLLLKLTGLRWEEFFDHGVFMSTALPNPIFCIVWKEPARESRIRVQARFAQLLPKE